MCIAAVAGTLDTSHADVSAVPEVVTLTTNAQQCPDVVAATGPSVVV